MIAASSHCSPKECETCALRSAISPDSPAPPVKTAKTAKTARMGWMARKVLVCGASRVLMALTEPADRMVHRGGPGANGERGPVGPMPKHEWKGTQLRFQQTDSKWGKWTDLQGKPGKAGSGGVFVGGGSSGGGTVNPGAFPLADNLVPDDEMVIVRDGVLMRVRVVLQAGEVPANAVTVNGQAVTVNGQFVVVTP